MYVNSSHICRKSCWRISTLNITGTSWIHLTLGWFLSFRKIRAAGFMLRKNWDRSIERAPDRKCIENAECHSAIAFLGGISLILERIAGMAEMCGNIERRIVNLSQYNRVWHATLPRLWWLYWLCIREVLSFADLGFFWKIKCKYLPYF